MKSIKANEVLDYFAEKKNSKSWPSNDLSDSPFNTFTCRLCGWQFNAKIYGSFQMGENPYDFVKKRILEHLAVRHKTKIPLKI